MIHYTAMADGDAACRWLCDPASAVSCHYLIARDGEVVRLVPEERRAWHAGAARWGAVTDVNSASIGIELDHPGDRPFPAPQIAALERLLDGVMARWAIPPERVLGHSDVAPGRKIDPGPRFDWRRLARGGRAVWPEPAEMAEALAPLLHRIGYDPEKPEETLLAAFRLRVRPWAQGAADATDHALAAGLAARWPVDGGARDP